MKMALLDSNEGANFYETSFVCNPQDFVVEA
jgi:hypothetical protein